MEKNNNGAISIQDNFLTMTEFTTLRDIVTADTFPWFFIPATVVGQIKDKESTPGLFGHTVYDNSIPCSELFQQVFPILAQLKVSVITGIKLNLQPRLPEPDFATFHSDTDAGSKGFQLEWTTSILYINTNNGYTEIEDGTKIDSVANRLVSFPSNMEHRGVSQTDEQTRILINLNYLKGAE